MSRTSASLNASMTERPPTTSPHITLYGYISQLAPSRPSTLLILILSIYQCTTKPQHIHHYQERVRQARFKTFSLAYHRILQNGCPRLQPELLLPATATRQHIGLRMIVTSRIHTTTSTKILRKTFHSTPSISILSLVLPLTHHHLFLPYQTLCFQISTFDLHTIPLVKLMRNPLAILNRLSSLPNTVMHRSPLRQWASTQVP